MIFFGLYFTSNLFFGGQFLFDGEILLGLKLIVGPLLSQGAGAGLRGSIIDGTAFGVKSGIVLLIICLAGIYFIYLQYGYGVSLPYIGFVNGYIWTAIGFVIGYLSANTTHVFELQESITKDNYIHKRQIDHIFSLDNEGWEEHIKEMEPSLNKDGWSGVTTPCETGSVFLTNNPNGSGCSLQPLFSETDSSNHIILIIGTYYPKGSIPFEDENFRSELISKCKEELGDSYDLDVSFLNFTPEMYNIEFRIFKNN